MSAYHHGLQSDHRFQAALRTCERSGDPFTVSGGPSLSDLLAKLVGIVALAFIIGFAGYFAWFAAIMARAG